MDSQGDLQLRRFLAPEIVFGLDARLLAGRYARNYGARKVMVVTDERVAGAGWSDDVIDSLRTLDIPFEVYSDVTPNPRVEEVMAGFELYRAEGCDVLIAVGGGSPIDCAKGIGTVASNGGNISDYEGMDKVKVPMPPLICVPTTAGSSADVSRFAVVLDPERKIKFCIIGQSVLPEVSLVDPVTTTTMSPHLSAATGLDALTHAIEAYVSTARSPLSDLLAREAIGLIVDNLPKVVERSDDLGVRGRMMLACLEAGLAFSNAGLGTVHAMSHSLGGLSDLPHGECNAILLEHVMAFNFDSAPERYELVGRAMGLDLREMYLPEKKSAIVEAVARLRRQVKVIQTLRQLGVRRSDIPELAAKAILDPCMLTNPRRLEQREVVALFERAF